MLADAFIPMIFVQWPLMLGALIPVIVVETLVIRRWVPLSYREAFTGVAKANLLSTATGVPMAWGVTLGIQFAFGLTVLLPVFLAAEHWHWRFNSPVLEAVAFVFCIAWLPPVNGCLCWMIPAAAALLLIPCFYVSIGIECRSCLRSWPNSKPALIRRGVYFANLASYAVLYVLACCWVAFAVLTNRP
jgi:hypothetical protein